MIRSYIGLPPPPPSSSPLPLPPSSPFHFHWCLGDVSPKLRRCITDHLSEQSAIVTECSVNIRLCRRCFGEHSPNHCKSIFSLELLVFYAQTRKASGSILCIIIHFTIADAKIPNGTQALWHWIFMLKIWYKSSNHVFVHTTFII